ncbi:hypothetical protein BH498_004835, partial [Salmonella enterica subsp. enterica serovar Typhimurium var. 5-]|nr:hypothetical protein [Salmonella enterica subsp. enterica serovar Typhimurium var. 5-]
LSGAIAVAFRVICCWFWLTAAPFAAKLSGAVRATDVMVNNILYSLLIPAFC